MYRCAENISNKSNQVLDKKQINIEKTKRIVKENKKYLDYRSYLDYMNHIKSRIDYVRKRMNRNKHNSQNIRIESELENLSFMLECNTQDFQDNKMKVESENTINAIKPENKKSENNEHSKESNHVGQFTQEEGKSENKKSENNEHSKESNHVGQFIQEEGKLEDKKSEDNEYSSESDYVGQFLIEEK